MALTREFRTTVMARVERDRTFREALLTEALNACLDGDAATGKALLRDLVNATLGFEGLAQATGIPAKSLHRMLAPRGNPSSESFFEIVGALQKSERVRLSVSVKPARGAKRMSAA